MLKFYRLFAYNMVAKKVENLELTIQAKKPEILDDLKKTQKNLEFGTKITKKNWKYQNFNNFNMLSGKISI